MKGLYYKQYLKMRPKYQNENEQIDQFAIQLVQNHMTIYSPWIVNNLNLSN